MLFGIASIVLDTGLELGVWVVKNSIITVYNGIYVWKYGNPETTQDQLNKLILVEKENQSILKDTLNRLRIQEMEIERIKKDNDNINDNFEKNIKALEQFIVIDHIDTLS